MANKIGVLNGIILFTLNFFIGIPLGIYFLGGLNSYTILPLNLLKYNGIDVYIWGIIDQTLTGKGWLDLGLSGRTSFLLIQLPLLISCITTIISSFVNSVKGKKGLIAGLLLMVIGIVIFFIDMVISGIHLELPNPVPKDQILSCLGLGFWILMISLIIQIVAIKIHPETVTE